MDKSRCYIYDDHCWYKLWYVWFILIVGLVIVICLAVWCYKFYKYKRRRRRLMRCSHPPLGVAPGPPAYEEPSHLPPPYEEAIKTRHIPPATTVIYSMPRSIEPWDVPPRTPPMPEVST